MYVAELDGMIIHDNYHCMKQQKIHVFLLPIVHQNSSITGPFTVPVDEEVESQHLKFISVLPGKVNTIFMIQTLVHCRTLHHDNIIGRKQQQVSSDTI